jgi:Methyltransferase domain
MVTRTADGSAGDADYATIGQAYTRYRRPDPRIAAHLAEALGPARTVLNVGAGAGSYEPADREVIPVEPSASMRAQRPAGLAAAVDATAENLPFDDDSFDAAMTTFSVHQWGDLRGGLREMRRVTRGPVVVLTCDPDLVRAFWLYEYARPRSWTQKPAATRPPRTSPTASAARSPSPRFRSRSTARTGSTRRTTDGRRPCSTRPRGCLAPPGASPGPRCTTASPGNSAVIWPTGRGTGGTATCAPSPLSTGPSSWSPPGPDCRHSPTAAFPACRSAS